MNTATKIATIIRDHALTETPAILAAYLLTADLLAVRSLIEGDILGSDSRLVLELAIIEATETAGLRASRCKAGSRAAKAHLAVFDGLCAAHDVLMAQEASRALAA